jgi:type IV pilus assembly protein PilM
MRAINSSLPLMDDNLPPGVIPDHKKLPIDQRKDLKIEYVESQFFPDLKVWWNDDVKTKWLQLNGAVVTAGGVPAATAPAAAASPATAAPAAATASAATPAAAASSGATPSSAAGYGAMMSGSGSMEGSGGAPAPVASDVSMINAPGPSGPGWVMEIMGYHFYNNPKNSADRRKAGAFHVVNTLIKNLQHGEVVLPMGPGQPPKKFTLKELGIDYVILARDPTFRENFPIPNPNYTPPVGGPGSGQFGGAFGGESAVPGGAALPKVDPNNLDFFLVKRYDFVVQFVWVETPLSVRLANQLAAEKAAAEKAEASQTAQGAQGTPPAAAPPAAAPPASTVPPEAAAPPATSIPPAVATPPVDPAAAAPAPVVPEAGAAPASAPAAAASGAGAGGAAAPASPPAVPTITEKPK